MNWSFRLVSILGISVRLHWTLPLLLLAEILRWWLTAPAGERGLFLGFGTALMAGYWVSILLHELGHCAAARLRGLGVDEILLWPLGGLAFIGEAREPGDEIRVALAGPLVSLLLACACLAAVALGGHALDWRWINPFYGWDSLQAGFATALGIDLFKLNVILALFNLCIPAYPMDGGRILRGLFAARIGPERAAAACMRLAIVVSILILLWGLIQHDSNGFFLLLIGGFVLYQALAERRLLQRAAEEGAGDGPGRADPSGAYSAFGSGSSPALPARRPGFFRSLRRRLAAARERRRRREEAALRAQVDRLLEKISREGPMSLTNEERQFLETASRRFQEFEARRGG